MPEPDAMTMLRDLLLALTGNQQEEAKRWAEGRWGAAAAAEIFPDEDPG